MAEIDSSQAGWIVAAGTLLTAVIGAAVAGYLKIFHAKTDTRVKDERTTIADLREMRVEDNERLGKLENRCAELEKLVADARVRELQCWRREVHIRSWASHFQATMKAAGIVFEPLVIDGKDEPNESAA